MEPCKFWGGQHFIQIGKSTPQTLKCHLVHQQLCKYLVLGWLIITLLYKLGWPRIFWEFKLLTGHSRNYATCISTTTIYNNYHNCDNDDNS